MQSICFDHVFSACKDNDLKSNLKIFERAGFIVDTDITKHVFGNSSGFILFSGTYLELLEFHDRSLWNPQLDADVENVLAIYRPYGIGVRCSDSRAIYDALKNHYPNAQEIFETGRKDGLDTSPIWRFYQFTKDSLPGAHCFSVEYLRHPTERSKLRKRVGPNGIFGISGYTFCSEIPAERRDTWVSTLKHFSEFKVTDRTIRMGVQTIEWIDPREYEERFGAKWQKVDSLYGELASVKLLTDDMNKTTTMLDRFFEKGSSRANKTCYGPHRSAGFAFEIEEGRSGQFFDELIKLELS